MTDLLVTGIGELVTNLPGARDLVGVVRDAVLAIVDGRVAWVGRERDLPAYHRDLPSFDCGGRAALPGFVDAHTHLVFAGDRSDEFARRLRGETYEQVLASGGGIRATVRAARAASLDDLVDEGAARLRRMLASGTTTAEVKSGYGLDVATERRQLEAVAALGTQQPVELVPTFLGAHVTPEEYVDRPDEFVALVEDELLPACAPLARYCDVFCDRGAFTVEQSRRVLEAGRRHGLASRIHANELGPTGGAQLAAELGAVSADHLAHLDYADIGALRDAGTVAVLLPATTLSLRTHQYARARALWDAGVTVALGTDCNPGTSYTESMPLVVALACLEMGLTPEEAVWAATRGGALAIERKDLGFLMPRAVGDLVVLDAPSYLHIPYLPGTDLTWAVIKSGEVVVPPPD